MGLAKYTIMLPVIVQMNDTKASFGFRAYSVVPIQAEYATPTSILLGKSIDTIVLNLAKVGLPSGPIQVGVFNNDTSVKKLFGTIDASSLGSGYAPYSFSLPVSQTYKIQSGDMIGIKFTGGDASNLVYIMSDQNNTFDVTNSYLTKYTTAWYYFSGKDLTMTLELHVYVNSLTVFASSAGGTYHSVQSVTLAASRTPSTIYYTTDGSTPTTSSTSGTSPVTVPVNTNSTLKFFAMDSFGNTSPIVTNAYTIILPVMYLNAAEISSTATNLSWNVLPHSSTGTAISYYIERHQNNTGTFTHLATVGSVNDYTDNTRVSGYPYVYRVTALENGKPVAISYPAKISPMLFGFFAPSWTPGIAANISSHLSKNDFGITSFKTYVTDMFPSGMQKVLLFCSVTDTTRSSDSCLNNSEKQTRIDAVGHGISYLMYDTERANGLYSSPIIEIQNPTSYLEEGGRIAHGHGYKYGAAPDGVENGKGNCFANPVGACGLFWKELRQVNWADVDLLDLQFEGFSHKTPLFVSDVQKAASWVYSHSSGHTLIMAQMLLPIDNQIITGSTLPELHAIKGIVNGTDIECDPQCNTKSTEMIFKSMMR
jgi:hypothetical protein